MVLHLLEPGMARGPSRCRARVWHHMSTLSDMVPNKATFLVWPLASQGQSQLKKGLLLGKTGLLLLPSPLELTIRKFSEPILTDLPVHEWVEGNFWTGQPGVCLLL